jgi:hypothetical protein
MRKVRAAVPSVASRRVPRRPAAAKQRIDRSCQFFTSSSDSSGSPDPRIRHLGYPRAHGRLDSGAVLCARALDAEQNKARADVMCAQPNSHCCTKLRQSAGGKSGAAPGQDAQTASISATDYGEQSQCSVTASSRSFPALYDSNLMSTRQNGSRIGRDESQDAGCNARTWQCHAVWN